MEDKTLNKLEFGEQDIDAESENDDHTPEPPTEEPFIATENQGEQLIFEDGKGVKLSLSSTTLNIIQLTELASHFLGLPQPTTDKPNPNYTP